MGKVDWDSLTEHECGLRLAQIRDTAREFYGMPKKYDPGYDYEALEARHEKSFYEEAYGSSLTELVRMMQFEMMYSRGPSKMTVSRDESHHIKSPPKIEPRYTYIIDELPSVDRTPSIKFKMEGARITKPPRG